jgi:hypothetical protein
MGDGREIPLELVYMGRRNGLHRWEATWTLAQAPHHLSIAVLPGRTSVSLGVVYSARGNSA